MDSGRRAFLRGSLLTSAGRASEARRQQRLGPPPPWHRELPLAELCHGCAHPCTDACETGIIRMHPQDHAHAGIPYLDFSASGCTFCKACVEACPLEIPVREHSAPAIGSARLKQEACIAWQDVICMACSGRCDYRAITTTHQRRPQIDADACNGCGMCVAACPTQALEVM